MIAKRLTILVILLFSCGTGWSADRLMMTRTIQTFPEAMLKLQDTLTNHGYTISRVQRVDIGLTSSGYKTDKYRVVFYGKPEEIRRMTREYPRLIPYLPLKIAIFAEGEETLLVASSPMQWVESDQPALNRMLKRWADDLQLVFDTMRSE